jgi:hypothetical protein
MGYYKESAPRTLPALAALIQANKATGPHPRNLPPVPLKPNRFSRTERVCPTKKFAAILEGQTQAQTIAAFAPGIFTVDQSGEGQGAILLANTGALASAATPALWGSYISIFCTGFGTVNNHPASIR